MRGAARGRHNHAKVHRLNEQLRALGLPIVRTLTQANRELVRKAIASAKNPPKKEEPKIIDPNRAKYEAKRKAREERRKKQIADKNARHAENKAMQK